MQIFAGHNIGGGHRPVLRDLYIFLLEDGVALGIGDQRGAFFPLDFVIGGNARLGKKTAKRQARGLLAGCGGVYRGRAGDSGGLGGGGGSFFFYLCHFFSSLLWILCCRFSPLRSRDSLSLG